MSTNITISSRIPRERLLRRPEVLSRIGFCTSTLYARIREGAFPPPVSLGLRCVAWRESDVDAWIADRIAESQLTQPRQAHRG